MGILNYVPTFKVVEPNRLTGLITGQVLSQFQATEGVKQENSAGVTYLENGVILGLNKDLTLGAFDSTTHKQALLHFTEELNTFLSGNNKFAVEEDQDGELYPRAIALYVGDSFTTNNYTGTLPAGDGGTPAEATYTNATANYAAVVDGVITLQDTVDENGYTSIFAIEESTLPTGEAAVRATYLGL